MKKSSVEKVDPTAAANVATIHDPEQLSDSNNSAAAAISPSPLSTPATGSLLTAPSTAATFAAATTSVDAPVVSKDEMNSAENGVESKHESSGAVAIGKNFKSSNSNGPTSEGVFVYSEDDDLEAMPWVSAGPAGGRRGREESNIGEGVNDGGNGSDLDGHGNGGGGVWSLWLEKGRVHERMAVTARAARRVLRRLEAAQKGQVVITNIQSLAVLFVVLDCHLSPYCVF